MNIKGLTLSAIFCFGVIFWINFIDFKFEELAEGKGQKIEYLIEGFCLSYISAYFFYFVNIYLIERREKKFILPFVAKNTFSIIINNHSIINCLKQDSLLSLDYFPDKEEFRNLLIRVNPKEKIPFYYKNENWIYLFRNRQESTLGIIEKIFLSGKYIDEHLRRILLEMQTSLYLKHHYAFNSDEFDDINLLKYQTVFVKYFELVEDLKKYYDKKLKIYYQ